MKKIPSLIVVQALLQIIFAVAAHAQISISPVINELKSKKTARGEFSLQNGSIRPIFVTIDAKRFTLSKSVTGEALSVFQPDKPLIEFSETSFRLGPLESRQVSYKLSCSVYPCEVEIWASFVSGKSSDGMQIRMSLPTAVYLCSEGKAKGCRARVRKAAGIEDTK